jgi:RHS repeat-associated protein
MICVYDLSNQMVQVLNNSNQVAAYTYNGAGQRIKKVTQTETRIFHYDLRGHLIAETNQSGQTIGEYIYLGDQLLSMIKPGESVYYFHNDHLGTPQVLTDDSQTIAWKAVYTLFGEAVPSIQTVENPFRFPGQYYDPETGLHYNYFRYYNPQTGRYITPDPIGLEGGINLFAYTDNNPSRFIDPSGLFESPWYLMWVPGQRLFDQGMTALENRQYGWAGAYFVGMIGEQVLTVLTLGEATAVRGATTCEVNAIQTTKHGATRIAGEAATRGGVLSEAEILATKGGRILTQADGAIVRILEAGPGKFNVVVEGEQGVITTFRHIGKNALDRLAARYGWR